MRIKNVYTYRMSLIDEEIVDDVKNFIGDNDNKLKILNKIVEYEKDNECKDCSVGHKEGHTHVCWEPGSDVPMQPAYIGMIKNAPFTNVILSTNSHTKLCLSDLDSVEHAVIDKEDEPDRFSQTWVQREVKRNSTSIDAVLDDVELTQEDVEEIEDIIQKNDALEYWYPHVVPELKHRDMAKKCILIMLASPEDRNGSKGRINVKIYGPPGTGKSTIKTFLKGEFSAETIDGARVSKSDLTYNKNSDELGKLPKAHKGILAIEEADEMDDKAIGATLTSLGESGRLEIRDMEIPAETRGVMLSNFESKREIISAWSPESLNRFDFTIKFDYLDDESKNDTLDWHYKHFRRDGPNSDSDIFKKYIKYVRQHNPSIEELDKIKDYKSDNVDSIDNVREGISAMNVAWTIARLNLEDVKLDHYKKAFDLVVDKDKDLKDKFSYSSNHSNK